MKKTATAAALLLGLSGATASAQLLPDDLQGSDTLNDFMQGLGTTLNLTGIDASFRYVGGGSGLAGSGMRANRQEIGPMSRFLNTTECTDAAGIAGVRGCKVIGYDAIGIYGNEAQACDVAAWGQTLTAQDLNFVPGIQGPASTTFDDWRTVLRILYFGQAGATNTNDPIATRCNTDLRRTLVAQWGNLFKGGCPDGACPPVAAPNHSNGGLKHAYRRDDLSGTTAVFIELLEAGTGVTGATFCNGTETQDIDPIRRACAGNGFAGSGDEVCHFVATPDDPGVSDYNLGVVLPILEVPGGFGQGALATQNCGSAPFGGAAFADVAWTLADVGKYGANCPNGRPPVGGTCKWPKRTGTGTTATGFGCLASLNDRPTGSASTVDGRIYNQWSRNSDGTVASYIRNNAPQRANASYFRIEQLSGCQSAVATDQIACLVSKNACSIGFAGQGASAPANSAPIQEIGLRNKQTTGTPFATFPVESDLNNYPLFRELYMCTLDGFASTGSQPPAFVNAQRAVWDAVNAANPTVIRNQAIASGFFPTPVGQPLVTRACP